MGDYTKIGKAVGLLVGFFLPLGVWKFIEIIVWIWRHVSVTVN